jgi:uncharacterized surface protein with fasciclin (FAS1) repeats
MKINYSSLLNLLGLLSAGTLFANPAIASSVVELNAKLNASNGAPAATAQTTPGMPKPTIPTVPSAPTVPAAPTIPTNPVPASPLPTTPLPKDPLPTMGEKPMDKPAEPVTEPAAAATSTIVDVASSNGSFKTLTAALKAAGLTDALKGEGPFTVFAPTDAAFEALPQGTVEKLLKPENKEKLVKLLTYHVVPGAVLSTDLKSGPVKSLEGSEIKVLVGKSGVMVNKAKVATADVKASNGVIHVIDRVIIPPDSEKLKTSAGKATTKPKATAPKPMAMPQNITPAMPK